MRTPLRWTYPIAVVKFVYFKPQSPMPLEISGPYFPVLLSSSETHKGLRRMLAMQYEKCLHSFLILNDSRLVIFLLGFSFLLQLSAHVTRFSRH